MGSYKKIGLSHEIGLIDTPPLCSRFDVKTNVGLFDLHSPSIISSILLYYTNLHLLTHSYLKKASIFTKALFYSRH